MRKEMRLESQMGATLWSALVQFLGMGTVHGWLEIIQEFQAEELYGCWYFRKNSLSLRYFKRPSVKAKEAEVGPYTGTQHHSQKAAALVWAELQAMWRAKASYGAWLWHVAIYV